VENLNGYVFLEMILDKNFITETGVSVKEVRLSNKFAHSSQEDYFA